MKKFILFVIAIFTINIANAQKGWSIEAIASPYISMSSDIPNYTTYYSTGVIERKTTYKISSGLNVYYFFNNNTSISLGVDYAQQGQNYKDYTYKSNIDTMTITRSIKNNYLKIPLIFHYYFNTENKLSFTASAGIYFSSLLYYNITKSNIEHSDILYIIATGSTLSFTDIMITPPYTTRTYDFLDNQYPFYKIDYGVTLAVGIEYKLNNKFTIPISINYQYGLKNIKNMNVAYLFPNAGYNFWDSTDNGAYHNSSFGISVGLRMKL